MAVRIQLRRDTAANWTAQNPTLAAGEIGVETDTKKLKAGDGTTAWTSLTYVSGSGGGATTLDDLTDVTITAAASGDILRHNGTAWVDTPGTTHFDAAGTAAAAVAAHEGAADPHPGYLTAAEGNAAYQPLDSDLTAIAALSTTSYGRALLALANQAAFMALLQASSDTVSGVVELATTAETTTGTDATRAVTPAGLLNATTASNINARIGVELAGTLVARRRNINFIQGSNVTLTITDDSVNEEVDVTIAASGGGGLSSTGKLALAGVGRVGTGRYYGPGEIGGAFSTSFPTATNWMTFIPWICPADMTADRIGIFSVSATGNIRLGIYSATSSGAPNALIVDSGAIVVGSGGVKEATISQALTGGELYYLACVADANLSISGLNTAQMGLVLGSATLGAAQGMTLAGSQTYGALPSSPPSIAYDSTTAGPCIQVRAA